MSILDEIVGKAKVRVAKAKEITPFEQLRERALALATKEEVSFEQALSVPGLSFICEIKKASPSKGVIASEFPYLEIAREYETIGASAISVLTEPEYFLGADRYLQEIGSVVNIPVLRKDFTIDSYQIYEAKLLGAQAVLLICASLDEKTLASYIETAAELHLSALVETHSKEEVEQALRAGAKIIGINNRNLKTFEVDIKTSENLRKLIPAGILTVSESGIKSPEDFVFLKNANFDAVLIGESFMRSADRRRFMEKLKNGNIV